MLKQINYGTTFNPQQNETFISQTYMSNCSNCTIKNSVFKYTDGSVLEVGGTGNTLNNNYFSYIDKTVCNLSSVMTGYFVITVAIIQLNIILYIKLVRLLL